MQRNFSISQVQCYRGCKKAWEYRYAQGLQNRNPARPLYLGSTIHKLLETRALYKDWKKCLKEEVEPEFNKLSEANRAELGEDFIEVCQKIMEQYDYVYANEDIKYVAVELPIKIKIKGNKCFEGIVDAVCELPDGSQYIMEHKTFSSKKMSMEQTWINAQTALYMKVLNDKGYNIKGVIWDMIKTACPEEPRVLKDGSFGKQYGTQTIMSFKWAGYSEAEIPEDIYENIKLNHLNYLERYQTPILDNVVDIIWDDFRDTVEEITKAKTFPHRLSKDCDFCSYKDLCKVEMTGGEIDSIKQLLFTTREERDLARLKEYQSTHDFCQTCMEQAKTSGFNLEPKWCIENCKIYKKENR